MRRTEPNLPAHTVAGLPWVPGIFVAGALALTVNIWIDRPVRCSIGLLLILAGLPFYRWWRKETYLLAMRRESSLREKNNCAGSRRQEVQRRELTPNQHRIGMAAGIGCER